MEELSKPDTVVGEQSWLRMVKGVLQFVGGGLVALHEEKGAPQLHTGENPGDREIRERLGDLGVAVDHTATLGRTWAPTSASPGPAPGSSHSQTGAILKMSFEEFSAAAAVHIALARPAEANLAATKPTAAESAPDGPIMGGRESAPANISTPEAPRYPRSFEELVQMAAPAGASGEPPPAVSVDDAVDAQDRLFTDRLDRLEARVMELQELLIALDEEGDRGQVTAPTESDEIASVTEPSPAKAPEEAGLDIAGEPPLQAGSSLRHNEVATVVQGPWPASRGANESVGAARPERGGGDDARAQRVARLEQTFDQFGKMVERLAARSRGTRPPPS
jgi:hypothetical protein